MTTIDPSATRLAETRSSDTVAADRQTEPQGTAALNTVEARLSIPARYEMMCQVGSGGMGVVYKVRDIETGEIVALKLLRPQIASDDSMRENLRREVCLARKVTHKNVCRIHEFYRSESAACISMEFVEGESLLAKLHRAGTLSMADSIAIARQICAGLREAHAQGIVHRDLKPANIMVDQSGHVTIMDFGIARTSRDDGHTTGTIVGTPEYMAPEQIELKPMGPRTDIYSLGLLLYEMVTGSQPFGGENSIAVAVKQLRELPKRPREVAPGLSSQLDASIMKCLRKNPESRFRSVDELDAALEKSARNCDSTGPSLDFEASATIQSVFDKGEAAYSKFVSLVDQVRSSIPDVNASWRSRWSELAVFVQASGVRGVARTGSAQLFAVVGVALLSTALTAGLANHKLKHREASANQAIPASAPVAASPALKSANSKGTLFAGISTTDFVPGTYAGEVVKNEEVDLRLNPVAATEASSETNDSSEPVAPIRSEATFGEANSRPAETTSKTKVHPALTAKLPIRTKQASGNVRAASLVSTTAQSPMHEPVYAVTTSVVDPISLSPASVPTSVTEQPKAAEGAANSPSSYLEVGSFKDTKWADDAVDKLTQLGFHAICTHKTVLWMQSYHVEVGPYASAADVASAQENLEAKGFRSHVVK